MQDALALMDLQVLKMYMILNKIMQTEHFISSLSHRKRSRAGLTSLHLRGKGFQTMAVL